MQNVENINITGGTLDNKEIQAYVDRGREQQPKLKLVGLDIKIDGDYVDLQYTYDKKPFERIRRITGYLVGTLDRFNDAKRTEVMDRVTHNVTDDYEDIFVDDIK